MDCSYSELVVQQGEGFPLPLFKENSPMEKMRKPVSHMRIPCNGKNYTLSYETIASLIISSLNGGTSFIDEIQVVAPSRWTYSDPDYTIGEKHPYTDYPFNFGGAPKITCDDGR